jgi:CubicO group peptidase (beta-lactamase class C family)
MKNLLTALILISALLGCKTDVKETIPEKEVSRLHTYFEKSTLPAALMGSVTRDGTMQWEAFGPAVWEATETIDENNIFRIFSMTKAIASVAALQLVEQGLIGLDDPLNTLMPEMSSIPILTAEGTLYTSEAPITLRHLLTHTAGFGYDFTSERLANFKPETWEYEDMPRLFEPGARWHYGTNTDWVGKVIEKVSGQDLEAYLREHITGPLEMNSTWFNVPEDLSGDIVSWGTRDSTGFSEYPRIPVEPETTFSAGGGLFSSPKDYLTFLRCLLNNGQFDKGSILKPESVAMLFSNQLPNGMHLDYNLQEEGLPSSIGRFPDETDVYSLAWAIEKSPDEAVRSEGAGYWAGIANSYYTIDPSSGVAVVYFTQFLPFNDKESYDFYRLFEKEVYSRVGAP